MDVKCQGIRVPLVSCKEQFGVVFSAVVVLFMPISDSFWPSNSEEPAEYLERITSGWFYVFFAVVMLIACAWCSAKGCFTEQGCTVTFLRVWDVTFRWNRLAALRLQEEEEKRTILLLWELHLPIRKKTIPIRIALPDVQETRQLCERFTGRPLPDNPPPAKPQEERFPCFDDESYHAPLRQYRLKKKRIWCLTVAFAVVVSLLICFAFSTEDLPRMCIGVLLAMILLVVSLVTIDRCAASLEALRLALFQYEVRCALA